ncbi:hypothetical protein CCR75_009496 [Bremia lactucae]|uniref:Uncharacterized protein n=1 Tax=Bremia lactucae TaxID=4779 RepID=A0A976IES6_BRELC|nr:hypothetical protein CCR75_009496 [Bremia lactucae]
MSRRKLVIRQVCVSHGEYMALKCWSTINKYIGLDCPFLLKSFSEWAASSRPSLCVGYSVAAFVGIRSFVSAMSCTQYKLAWKRSNLRVRAGLVAAIYTRMLALLSHEHREAGGLGRISNLLSVDVGRIVRITYTLFKLILIPAEIIVAQFRLNRAVSFAVLAGVAICLHVATSNNCGVQSVTVALIHSRDILQAKVSRRVIRML